MKFLWNFVKFLWNFCEIFVNELLGRKIQNNLVLSVFCRVRIFVSSILLKKSKVQIIVFTKKIFLVDSLKISMNQRLWSIRIIDPGHGSKTRIFTNVFEISFFPCKSKIRISVFETNDFFNNFFKIFYSLYIKKMPLNCHKKVTKHTSELEDSYWF